MRARHSLSQLRQRLDALEDRRQTGLVLFIWMDAESGLYTDGRSLDEDPDRLIKRYEQRQHTRGQVLLIDDIPDQD